MREGAALSAVGGPGTPIRSCSLKKGSNRGRLRNPSSELPAVVGVQMRVLVDDRDELFQARDRVRTKIVLWTIAAK